MLVRGLAGDRASYHSFLKELTGHLRAFLRKRLAGFHDDVEDLVQETLIAVHARRHTYDPGRPLTPWVHAIAKYKLADLARGRAARETAPLDDDSGLFSVGETEALDARRDVTTLLAKLPDRQRLPIFYTKLQGRSVAETARSIGMSESAVKVGVHRGLKALAMLVRGSR